MTTLFRTPTPKYVPPPPAPAPVVEPEDTKAMEEARKKAMRRAAGRASTILTGGAGVPGAPTLLRKKLLGE